VVALGDEAWPQSLALCQSLRSAGTPAEVDYRRRSLRAQLRFADAENYRWAAIIGEEEVAEGTVTLRDMVSGEQETLPREGLVRRLAREGEE
jgi:histidyl-tRNA synthetase